MRCVCNHSRTAAVRQKASAVVTQRASFAYQRASVPALRVVGNRKQKHSNIPCGTRTVGRPASGVACIERERDTRWLECRIGVHRFTPPVSLYTSDDEHTRSEHIWSAQIHHYTIDACFPGTVFTVLGLGLSAKCRSRKTVVAVGITVVTIRRGSASASQLLPPILFFPSHATSRSFASIGLHKRPAAALTGIQDTRCAQRTYGD